MSNQNRKNVRDILIKIVENNKETNRQLEVLTKIVTDFVGLAVTDPNRLRQSGPALSNQLGQLQTLFRARSTDAQNLLEQLQVTDS